MLEYIRITTLSPPFRYLELEEGLDELSKIVEEAVRHGHKKVVELLFSCDKDLDNHIFTYQFNPEGDSILHILCSSKKWEEKDREQSLEELLLYLIEKKGYEVKVKNHNNQTPFHLACSLRNPLAAEVLLSTRRVDIDCPDKHGKVPLHFALEKQHNR